MGHNNSFSQINSPIRYFSGRQEEKTERGKIYPAKLIYAKYRTGMRACPTPKNRLLPDFFLSFFSQKYRKVKENLDQKKRDRRQDRMSI